MHAPPHTPQRSTDRYINPTFTTDSLEDEDSSSSPCQSPSPSPKRYTFTPRRVAKLPRAWERAPATPFAPRTEGQKIWKRVPLGEIQANSKIAQGTHNREEEELKVLKRLRADRNEENATYLGTKWDDTPDMVKRKVSHGVDNRNEFQTYTESISKQAVGGITLDAEPAMEDSNEILEPSDNVKLRALPSDNIPTAGAVKEIVLVDNRAVEKGRENIMVDDSVSAPAEEDSLLEVMATYETSNLAATPKDIHDIPLVEPATPAGGSSPGRTEEVHAHREREYSSSDAGQDQSPHARRRRSSLAALFTGHGLMCLPEPAQDVTTLNVNPTSSQPPAAAHDDTAFLHEFLTRARAQKAAKVSLSPERPVVCPTSPVKKSRHALAAPTPNSALPENLHLRRDDMSERTSEATLPASPCRRSQRTRLQRAQSAITAVPGRRSNGTEYVFRPRSEAQEIAFATRANTKRNKGDAMHPKVKLPYINGPAMNPSPTKSPRRRKGCKVVSWDEELAHFGEGTAEAPGATEQMAHGQEASASARKARKMRRLGAANGTPAPRTVTDAAELQTPTRKLRARGAALIRAAPPAGR